MNVTRDHDSSNYLFTVRYTSPVRDGHLYLNYLSDPRESAIKLPQYILDLEDVCYSLYEGNEEPATIDEEIEWSALRHLYMTYGFKDLPPVYLAANGKDLVMNVHVYRDHSKQLTRLLWDKPQDEPRLWWPKQAFALYTLRAIQMRIIQVVMADNEPTGRCTFYPMFRMHLQEELVRPTQRRASLDQIWPLAKGPNSVPESSRRPFHG